MSQNLNNLSYNFAAQQSGRCCFEAANVMHLLNGGKLPENQITAAAMTLQVSRRGKIKAPVFESFFSPVAAGFQVSRRSQLQLCCKFS